MVKPAASAMDEPRRAASPNTDKPKNPATLQQKFAVLLAAASAPKTAAIGHQAYFGHHATQRVEASHRAMKTAEPRSLRARAQDEALVLDPLARSLAMPGLSLASSQAALSPAAPTSLAASDLVAFEEAVRRVAWGGDRRRGVARIELGGEYAGTAIVIRGEGRDLAVRVEVGRGSDARDLPARLVERLEARGLRVTELEVR
jgi:hypothetical protein